MTSQSELGRAFERGATHGRASSVQIREAAGGHALVDTRGKDAVLAFRYPSGNIVAFEGWYGYSTSTSCMMTKLGISPACRHDEHRDYRAHATSADKVALRELRGRGWDRTTAEALDEWLDEHDPTFIGGH